MKAGWQVKPLQSLCDDFRQDIVDGPFGSELQRKDYITDGVPVLKIQNIKPFAIELKKMDFISPAKFGELSRHSYRCGDIVMTKLGRPLGVSAIVEDLDEGVIVADLVRIRAQRVDTKYLCYHLNSQSTNDFINSKQKGTTRPRVTLSVVRELPISVPSPEEQHRIVALLDEAFDGIATAKANAEKNRQNARALFESHLQSVFTERGEGWVERRLGDIAEVQSGGTPKVSKKEFWNGDIPWYSSGELNSTFTTNPERHITKAGLANSNAKLFPKGALLVGMYDTAALKMSILDRDGAFNQAIAGIKPNDRIDVEFALHAINAEKPRLLLERRGVRQKNLSLGKIKEIAVPLPTPEVQRSVVERLREVASETQRLESLYQQKLTALDDLKKSLLHQAFSGQL